MLHKDQHTARKGNEKWMLSEGCWLLGRFMVPIELEEVLAP